jgi:carbonic anhydrase/acetyltransferase-like protein (isoleucine patch superfamily)
VIGRVTLGDYSSVWAGCVLRGDINTITIGKRTNIQDLTCIHLESNRGTKIADDVTVGHQVTLHACTIKRYALIGIQSIILDGAVIGEGCCWVPDRLMHGQN